MIQFLKFIDQYSTMVDLISYFDKHLDYYDWYGDSICMR